MEIKPDWIKGIRSRLDYGWLYKGLRGILHDNSIYISNDEAERESFLLAKGIDPFLALECFQCGTCSVICPRTLLKEGSDALSARRMIHENQLGMTKFEGDDIWLCSTCGACTMQCPRDVKILDFIRSLRTIEVELGAGKIPDSLRRAMTNIASTGNPFGESPELRDELMSNLNIRSFTSGMELLYFPGCFPAYDARARKVAEATVNVLEKANIDFGTLGSLERCCGESVRKAGNETLFRKLAEHNSQVFRESGVKTLLTTSAHCYHTFKNEYPEIPTGINVMHSTQYLVRLIKQGKLKFRKEVKARVTYQDPCYLGRLNDVYEEPRQILRAIPGLELVEMPLSRSRSLCCGGGGGRIWMDSGKGERLSDLRLEQAMQTGANVLAVACPYCLLNFEGSRLTGDCESDIEIKDISELLWEAMAG